MARRIIDLDDPDRFTGGATGEPGERTFFLQAEQGHLVTSVGVEREQVRILAERVLAIIDELERRGLTAIDVTRPDIPSGIGPRSAPPQQEFQVDTLIIAWDEEVERLIIEARSDMPSAGAGESALSESAGHEDEIPDDAPIGPDVLRVHLSPLMAQRFARQAAGIVEGGQPTCPFCGGALDPRGHLCPPAEDGDYVH